MHLKVDGSISSKMKKNNHSKTLQVNIRDESRNERATPTAKKQVTRLRQAMEWE